MKVHDDRPPLQEIAPAPAQNRRTAAETSAPFRQMMHSADTARGEALRSLLDRITEQGQRLSERTDVSELKQYRRLVSDFLDQALRGTYQPDRDSLFDSRGRFREYATVRKVDDELEKLTRQVLSDQQDNLAILDQLGIIRGMLVDLLV